MGAFEAKLFADAKPADGLGEGLGLGADNPGEGGGHFGTESDRTSPLIREGKKLADDFGTGFFDEKFKWFEDGTIVFGKGVEARGLAPGAKYRLAKVTFRGEKFPESGETLEHRSGLPLLLELVEV